MHASLRIQGIAQSVSDRGELGRVVVAFCAPCCPRVGEHIIDSRGKEWEIHAVTWDSRDDRIRPANVTLSLWEIG